jgi:hypothetical protein
MAERGADNRRHFTSLDNTTMKRDLILVLDVGGNSRVTGAENAPYIGKDEVVIGRGSAVFEMTSKAENDLAIIAKLQEAKQLLQAQTQAKIEAMDARIQSLLAITHDG